MKLQRYTFEDALIRWGAEENTKKAYFAVGVALRICSQLNWSRGGVLRYKTLDACKNAGVSRSSYYRSMPYLVEEGFFILIKGNYHANIPVSHQETKSHQDTDEGVSHQETNEGQSHQETNVYQQGTEMSHQDNPFSSVLFSDTNDLGWIKENAIEGIQHLFLLDAERSSASVPDEASISKEQSWLEKAQQRQASINAEFAEMMML